MKLVLCQDRAAVESCVSLNDGTASGEHTFVKRESYVDNLEQKGILSSLVLLGLCLVGLYTPVRIFLSAL
jgi:hypothetical protein